MNLRTPSPRPAGKARFRRSWLRRKHALSLSYGLARKPVDRGRLCRWLPGRSCRKAAASRDRPRPVACAARRCARCGRPTVRHHATRRAGGFAGTGQAPDRDEPRRPGLDQLLCESEILAGALPCSRFTGSRSVGLRPADSVTTGPIDMRNSAIRQRARALALLRKVRARQAGGDLRDGGRRDGARRTLSGNLRIPRTTSRRDQGGIRPATSRAATSSICGRN